MPASFYNTGHYGDIFVSRSFIKDIIQKKPDNYCYIHNYKKNYLFNDIDIRELNRTEIEAIRLIVKNEYCFYTWYAAHEHKYFKDTGCTIQTLYKLFKDVYDALGIQIDSIENYIPAVNFEKYNLTNYTRNKNTVLVCTNVPLSGQSSENSMDYLVNRLAERFPEKLFLITNRINGIKEKENVFYTENILKENNLIELSWLSKQCSSIIGRSSGPYTFSLLKENLDDGVNYFEIVYSYPIGDFTLSNFGLSQIGYNNFHNICARSSWDDIYDFIADRHDKL
jgi:hypothetical protein